MTNLTLENWLDQIIEHLEGLATGDDSASVQINTDGNCILRVGVTYVRTFTVKEFVEHLQEQTDEDDDEYPDDWMFGPGGHHSGRE